MVHKSPEPGLTLHHAGDGVHQIKFIGNNINHGDAPHYADIGVVRERLLMQALSLSDVEREHEISQLAAQIEFLGVCEHARRLCARIAHLVGQRPPEYVAALERALGLSGNPRD